jgi:hypothetical protein
MRYSPFRRYRLRQRHVNVSEERAQTTERTQVGFVALGNVGRHMARNLVGGDWEVLVHDALPVRAAEVAAQTGAIAVEEAREPASATTIITMLPNGDIVREVVIDSGFADELAPGRPSSTPVRLIRPAPRSLATGSRSARSASSTRASRCPREGAPPSG